MASHSEGDRIKNFCTQRKTTCKCGAKYRGNCNPAPSDWTLTVGGRKFEAHHLLCVASVTAYLLREKGILDVVKQTDWCVNEDPNMFAMPLWGHFVKWYSNAKHHTDNGLPKPPAFADVPCHNYGHNGKNSYKKDVDSWAMNLASQYKSVAKAQHKIKAAELAGKLKSESGNLRARLQNKGKGLGKTKIGGIVQIAAVGNGTHAAWVAALDGDTAGWYEPFSMAAKAAPRDFPLSKRTIGNLEKRVKALLGI